MRAKKRPIVVLASEATSVTTIAGGRVEGTRSLTSNPDDEWPTSSEFNSDVAALALFEALGSQLDALPPVAELRPFIDVLRQLLGRLEKREVKRKADAVAKLRNSGGGFSAVPTKEFIVDAIHRFGVVGVYPHLADKTAEEVIAGITGTPDEKWYPPNDVFWQRGRAGGVES